MRFAEDFALAGKGEIFNGVCEHSTDPIPAVPVLFNSLGARDRREMRKYLINTLNFFGPAFGG
jgi:hypothetical protein